jgi:hypothetical protein
MEDHLQDIDSDSFDKKKFQEVFAILGRATEEAADLRDGELVRDPALRKALGIVEDFLRRRKRVCYGGMAINAHLPQRVKFYDFTKVLPDYDFFTPEPDKDVKELLDDFKNHGFKNAVARLGMHEGTTKIFVNYTAVADITFIPNWLFSILQKRSINDDGIMYADANFLRMNMYLELSRPRGEVERWEKVYKRLALLNSVKQPYSKHCGGRDDMTRINRNIHEVAIDYIVRENLIFAGAELKRIYSHPNTLNHGYVIKSTSPILIYTSEPESHLQTLRQLIHDADPGMRLQTAHWAARGEIIPEMFGILSGGRAIVVLVREQFCHAYNVVSLPKGRHMRIASLDTAITLFYTLSFVKGLNGLVPNSPHCFADALVQISVKTRDQGMPSKFPLFPTTCHGHQPSKASLLEAKKARVESLKRKTRKIRSGKSTQRGGTARNKYNSK